MRPNGKPVEILLVEDNPGDIRLVMEAMRESSHTARLSVVQDGMDAMEFLRRQGRYADAPRPDLILLDLNLPRKDGREVLAELKPDLNLRMIPVVVLTSSRAEQDVRDAYELHANCYVVKPPTYEKLMATLQWIERFWLELVELPPKPRETMP
jgi:CheY-like chemotaxis protein